METGDSAPNGDAGADNTVDSAPSSTWAAPTTTEDLAAGIMQRYSLGSAYSPGLYASRAGSFYSSFEVAPPPKVRERRKPFVLSTYLKNDLGVAVYQPTGYSIRKNMAGTGVVAEEQFSSQLAAPSEDPVDQAVGKQKPMLDRKIKDAPKPEEEGRLVKESDLRRRAIHVSKGRKDQYDYGV